MRSVGTLLLLLLFGACVRHPRWTPEKVAPPASLENALTNARQALADGRASLEGDGPTTMSLSRDGAILTVLARNRALAVERYGPDISATRVSESRAVFDPSLLATASYGLNSAPVTIIDESGDEILDSVKSRSTRGNATVSQFLPTGTDVFLSGGLSRSRTSLLEPGYQGSWSVEVNQSLLRGFGTNVNLVSLRQARNTAVSSEHALRGFVLDLVSQIEDAYWNLVLAYETLKIRQFSIKLAQDQLEESDALIEVEKLARTARAATEAALAARKAELVDANAALETRTIELIRLLNPENEAQWSLAFEMTDPAAVEKVDLRSGVSAQLADKYRPELAQSRLDLANRDLEVVRTRNGLLPRLDAFASYGRISSGNSFHAAHRYLDDSDFDNYDVGLTFDMAPLNRAERARNRRARFEQQRAEASIRNLEQIIETEVRSAVIEVRRQWDRIPATREEVESRQEELDTERDLFQEGKSKALDVLLVQRALIQAQLEEVTARIRYIQALTALYRAEGTLLERRGVGTKSDWESKQ